MSRKEIEEGKRTFVEVHVLVAIREGAHVAHNQIVVETTKTVPVRMDEEGAHLAVQDCVERIVQTVEQQAVGELWDYNQRLRFGPHDHYRTKLSQLKAHLNATVTTATETDQ